MKLPPCKCGGHARWSKDLWGMSDQLRCSKCDYRTVVYFDGAEYAMQDWKERNK